MRYLHIWLFIGVVSAIGTAQQRGDPVQVLLQRNRDVLSAKEAYEADLERIKATGVLFDPMMEVWVDPMESGIMVSQMFPLWGKLKRERKMQILKAEMALFNLKMREFEAVTSMYQSWASYVKSKNSLEILQHFHSELEDFRSIALTQYSTGMAMSQHPILKLEIEISRVKAKINIFESELETAIRDLDVLFDGNFSDDLFEEGLSEDSLVKGSEKDWLERARQFNPQYQMALRSRGMKILEKEMAVRGRYPDLITGVSYMRSPSQDMQESQNTPSGGIGFKLGINLPVWIKKNRANVASAELEINSSEQRIAHIWNRLERDILTEKKRLAELDETYRLYRTKIVPEAEQMVASAFSGYQTGQISFIDLLDSERMVAEVHLDFEETQAEILMTQAMLIEAMGYISVSEK